MKIQTNQQPFQVQQSDTGHKSSKFKSLISSMKTKAMVLMKTEKIPAQPTPLYKLTILQNLPEQDTEKILTPKKYRESEKLPVKREKILIKPKKMYVESDESDSVKSDKIHSKTKIKSKSTDNLQGSARKNTSLTSLDSNLSEASKIKSLQNIAQSVSNLDSILELKKEIRAAISTENSKKISESDKLSSASENSLNEEILNSEPKTPIVQKHIEHTSDEESHDFFKNKMQKGVLKNYPSTGSLVKKKVLFDLESEGTPSELKQDVTEEPVKSKVKTNLFFESDKDEDSTSATSSVFNGSKFNLNQSPKDVFSTKAQINAPRKTIAKNTSDSDFDISDLL